MRQNVFFFCWAVVCRAQLLRERLLQGAGRYLQRQAGALGRDQCPWVAGGPKCGPPWGCWDLLSMFIRTWQFRAGFPLEPQTFPFTCWLGFLTPLAYLRSLPACLTAGHPMTPPPVPRPRWGGWRAAPRDRSPVPPAPSGRQSPLPDWAPDWLLHPHPPLYACCPSAGVSKPCTAHGPCPIHHLCLHAP